MIVQVQAMCFRCHTVIQLSTDLEENGDIQRRLSICKCDEREAKLISKLQQMIDALVLIKGSETMEQARLLVTKALEVKKNDNPPSIES